MSQITQLSIPTIVNAAFFPAIMYLIAVFFGIYQNSQKDAISGEVNSVDIIIWREYILLLPPLVILIILLFFHSNITYTIVAVIAVLVVSSWFTQQHRLKTKNIFNALAWGAKNILATGISLIAIGLVTSIIRLNNIDVTFSQTLINLAGNSLILTFLFVGLTALFLGRSLPTIAAYIVLAMLAIPSLEEIGLSPLTAHMIVFWLAQISHITPPICLAAGAAAEIAQTQRLATTLEAWKLGFSLYLIPILFTYTALIDGNLWQKINIFFFGLVGLYILSGSISGYLFRPIKLFERILLVAIAPLLFLPDLRFNILGLVLTIIAYFYQTKIADK